MEVDLTPEQDALIRRAIDSGRISRREDALQEAVEIWARLEQIREELLAVFDKSQKVELVDGASRSAINLLLHMALGEAPIQIDEDQFATFDEWNGEADRTAYADL